MVHAVEARPLVAPGRVDTKVDNFAVGLERVATCT